MNMLFALVFKMYLNYYIATMILLWRISSHDKKRRLHAPHPPVYLTHLSGVKIKHSAKACNQLRAI